MTSNSINKLFSKPDLRKIDLKVETLTRQELNAYYNKLVDKLSDKLLSFAREKHKKDNNGIVHITFKSNYAVNYLDNKKFKKIFKTHKVQYARITNVLKTYEPDTQFVVMIEDAKGTSFLIHSKRHLS